MAAGSDRNRRDELCAVRAYRPSTCHDLAVQSFLGNGFEDQGKLPSTKYMGNLSVTEDDRIDDSASQSLVGRHLALVYDRPICIAHHRDMLGRMQEQGPGLVGTCSGKTKIGRAACRERLW